MRSLISIQDLTREDTLQLINIARDFKRGKRKKVGGEVALLFFEPSTRTRVSFEKACRDLGLGTYTVSAGESSTVKGESFFDTLKTFEAMGFKGVVFRVPFVFFPYQDVVRSLSISLINAGDGTHQHPTQGLTDLFTLTDRLGDVKGLKVLYVGDIAHSRVFRSGAPLLTMFGAEVSVCGPRALVPKDLKVFGVDRVFDDLDDALEWADVVVWLRIQRERHREASVISEKSYFRRFGLTRERYKKIKGYFMHPGPVNREVDIDGELIYSEKSLIYDQVRNGVYVRMAVLKWCLEDG
ncbi:MAG: aspartate carbamoyltransferase catalytic subunit [Aquificota bacterium]|nr:aspartate carbamoyltransferase catalytic subunit [Aquificota bacterium]